MSEVVNGGYYEITDVTNAGKGCVAHIRKIAKYYPDDVVYTTIYDSKGRIIGNRDFWLPLFTAMVGRRVRPREASKVR